MGDKESLTVENQQYGPNKQKFRDDFASEYPDIDMDDEEAYYGALNERNERYAGDRSRLESLEGAQRAFGEAMDENPRAAEFFLEMTREGGEPIRYLIEHYASEFADMVNDPDNPELREALAKKVSEDAETLASRKRIEDEAEANIGPSLDALSEVAGEMGLSDEEIAQAFDAFVEMTRNLVVDKVDAATWRMFINGMNHDADVEQARMEGETAGRNAKISEKLRGERPSPMSLGGSSQTGSAENPRRVGKSEMTRSVWDDE